MRRSFAAFGPPELDLMERMLSDWPDAFAKQKNKFEILTGQLFSLDFTKNRAEISERLADMQKLIDSEYRYDLFIKYMQSPSDSLKRLAFVRQVTDTLEGFLAEDGIAFEAEQDKLTSYRQMIAKVVSAKQSALSGMWWDLFGKREKGN